MFGNVGGCLNMRIVTPFLLLPVQPVHAVEGPHKEHQLPAAGSSGTSVQAGRPD
jgi:hypothetical protein